ncbi:Hypothetical predicted protein [Paramuricea clavata]|uniref:Uncharacterized protein n=1 Tax=Paramuricea clavata TaxID=317549 RepID=A0A7D9E6L1_PARCT|nr:Hypothetical predicted protein [Paramuricea clavata]
MESCTEIWHLQDVNEGDATILGLTKFEFRRLERCFSEYQDSHLRSLAQSRELNTALYRPSTQSKVVSLPPGMKNFVQTRDGMGNIIVSTKSLQGQFKNLTVSGTNLQCPLNRLYLILSSWKWQLNVSSFQRTRRIARLGVEINAPKGSQMIYGITKSPAIDNWSPHLKMQSVYGLIEMTMERYPDIVAFQNANKSPGKKNYDNLCSFVENFQNAISLAQKNINVCEREIRQTEKTSVTEGKPRIIPGLREQNKFFLDLLPKLEAALAFVKEFIALYERMLQECKAQYGVSMKEQHCLRKRKMNQKKDIRRKQQRQEIVIKEDRKEDEVKEDEANEQDDKEDVIDIEKK